MRIMTHALPPFFSMKLIWAGVVIFPSIATPRRRTFSSAGRGTLCSFAMYVFSTPKRGWVSRKANSPSFVSRSSPVVWKSRRPTGKTREESSPISDGAVLRPSRSFIVVTTLSGLYSMM